MHPCRRPSDGPTVQTKNQTNRRKEQKKAVIVGEISILYTTVSMVPYSITKPSGESPGSLAS